MPNWCYLYFIIWVIERFKINATLHNGFDHFLFILWYITLLYIFISYKDNHIHVVNAKSSKRHLWLTNYIDTPVINALVQLKIKALLGRGRRKIQPVNLGRVTPECPTVSAALQ